MRYRVVMPIDIDVVIEPDPSPTRRTRNLAY